MLPLDQAGYLNQDKGAYDGIAQSGAYSVVCRTLVDHHGQCRHVQGYLTGMIILPTNRKADIARCILEGANTRDLVQLIRNNYSSSGRQGRCRGHDLGHGVCGPVKRMCMVIPFFNELVQLCMKLIFGCKIHNS
jgi:hypothetical protein